MVFFLLTQGSSEGWSWTKESSSTFSTDANENIEQKATITVSQGQTRTVCQPIGQIENYVIKANHFRTFDSECCSDCCDNTCHGKESGPVDPVDSLPWPIIGSVVGGLLVVVAIVLGIFFCCKSNTNTNVNDIPEMQRLK